MRWLAILLLAVFGLCLAACAGDEAEGIEGTWNWRGVYETFESDGTWNVRVGAEGQTYDWGTYTHEDGVLTMTNADGSACTGGAAVFEVAFSEDGSELHETFISDSCEQSDRGQDRVLVRYAP